jgi:hypothetical protein
MSSKNWLRFTVAFIEAAVVSCSLAVDADSLNEGCPNGTKPCGSECVSASDPDRGCGRASCQPCALQHATAICSPEGECIVGSCQGKYENCDDNSRNGCEVDTSTSTGHCGGCRAPPCNLANALPDCANGKCAILRCFAGYGNCDDSAENGCEVNTTNNSDHCGDCLTACSPSERCVGGACGPL